MAGTSTDPSTSLIVSFSIVQLPLLEEHACMDVAVALREEPANPVFGSK